MREPKEPLIKIVSNQQTDLKTRVTLNNNSFEAREETLFFLLQFTLQNQH